MKRIPALLCAVLLAAACANGDPTAPFDDVDVLPTPVDDIAATVQVAQTELGDILVTARGSTLYLFTEDTQGSPDPEGPEPISTCVGRCQDNWPPLRAERESLEVDDDGESMTVPEAPVAGEGVRQDLLSTFVGEDGSVQVAYNGWPLYTFTRSETPGDLSGHGFNDVWFAVGPDGEAIGAS